MRADGTTIYLYEAAQSMTHGGAHVGTVHNNSGVALLALRRDGFVSVQADYIFPAQCDACERSYDHLPSFTTVPLLVPRGCPPPVNRTRFRPGSSWKEPRQEISGGVVLRVNLITSVVGFVVSTITDHLSIRILV